MYIQVKVVCISFHIEPSEFRVDDFESKGIGESLRDLELTSSIICRYEF